MVEKELIRRIRRTGIIFPLKGFRSRGRTCFIRHFCKVCAANPPIIEREKGFLSRAIPVEILGENMRGSGVISLPGLQKKGDGNIFEKDFLVISKLVEKEIGFISEKLLFPAGSANRESSLRQIGPLPGQKIIRLAQKGGDSSFPDAGFRRFSQVVPCHRVSLRKRGGET